MNNNIYVVYDSEKETKESLDNFKQVMIKAEYPSDKIIALSTTEFDEYIERKEILSFVLCLNTTFKDYCIKYSDILEVPVFEFFSKDYHDTSKNIHIAGILLDVKDIFQVSYKRYAWKVLTEFYKYYKQAVLDKQVVLDMQEDISTVDDTVKECSLEEVVVFSEVKEVEMVEETISSSEEITDEVDLKAFYLNVKNLMSQMNIVQAQIKYLDKQFNNEK
jgi:hypothetical protein